MHSRRHSARRQPLGDVRTDSSAVGSSRHPRGVRPKRGPTPEVHRPGRYLLNHHSAPSSAQTARSTVLLAASSVRDAPTRRSARGRVGVGGLAAVEAQHAAERRDVVARSSSEDEILLHWMSLQVAPNRHRQGRISAALQSPGCHFVHCGLQQFRIPRRNRMLIGRRSRETRGAMSVVVCS